LSSKDDKYTDYRCLLRTVRRLNLHLLQQIADVDGTVTVEQLAFQNFSVFNNVFIDDFGSFEEKSKSRLKKDFRRFFQTNGKQRYYNAVRFLRKHKLITLHDRRVRITNKGKTLLFHYKLNTLKVSNADDYC